MANYTWSRSTNPAAVFDERLTEAELLDAVSEFKKLVEPDNPKTDPALEPPRMTGNVWFRQCVGQANWRSITMTKLSVRWSLRKPAMRHHEKQSLRRRHFKRCCAVERGTMFTTVTRAHRDTTRRCVSSFMLSCRRMSPRVGSGLLRPTRKTRNSGPHLPQRVTRPLIHRPSVGLATVVCSARWA